MAARHLVNGEMSGWFIFGRFVGPLLATAGLGFLLSGEAGVGWLLVVLGIAWTTGMEITAALRRRKRVWLELIDGGMVVSDRTGTRELRDHDIVSIAYFVKPVYANGVPAGYVRTARLWPAKSPVIDLHNQYGENVADPLGELLGRVTVLLKNGFAQALEHGVEVGGDRWRLNKQQLRCQVGKREEVVLLANIAAVQSFGDKMSVWLRGQESPSIQLPIHGRNVWLLPELLEPYLAPADTEAPIAGLGRILFSRPPSRTWLFLSAASAVVCLVLGGLLVVSGLRKDSELIVFGAVLLAASPLLALAAAYCLVALFRCQEWGVYQRGLFGSRQLLYKQVASFAYSATRHYHNGVYTGTHLSMRFTPFPGAGAPISYTETVRGGDQDLDSLREFVSNVIANQMHQRLANGETVPWTANLSFTPQGITYRPAGFLGRKEPVFLPYEKYGGYNLDQGVFYLFAKDAPKAVLSESVSEANFFPGFHLLLLLLHAEAGSEGKQE